MKVLSCYLTPIAELTIPGDVRKRMRDARVIELAESIRVNGQIAPIVMRPSDGRIIAGRDRLAALLINGARYAMVQRVTCLDVEAVRMEIAENLHRRQDSRTELLARYTETLEGDALTPPPPEARTVAAADGPELDEMLAKAKVKVARDDPPEETTQEVITATSVAETPPEAEPAKPGRPKGSKSRKGKAAEIVADAAGIDPKSVMRATQRQAKKEAAATAPAPAESPAPCIDGLGQPVPADIGVAALLARLALEDIDKAMRRALADLTHLRKTVAPYPVNLGQLRDALRTAAHLSRAYQPAAVCKFCRGAKPDCATCWGAGFMTVEQAERLIEGWRRAR